MDRDARIGLSLAGVLLCLAFVTGEPVAQEADPFDHVVTSSLTRLDLSENHRLRIGEEFSALANVDCVMPIVLEHYSSQYWFGVCDNPDLTAFAWAPNGDITESGRLPDVLGHTFGFLTGLRWISPDRIDFNFIQY